MRIVHLAAGAGGMYCGACANDMAMARAVMARGHEVIVLPLYTPLRTEGDAPYTTGPIFLGGINAYLQQNWPSTQRLPGPIKRALDSPALLRWVSRFAIQTDPADLGPMTVSVLQGRDGRQQGELAKLVEFLRDGPPVDVLSITNSLLSGTAPPLAEALDVPIICGFQGEDGFLAGMSDRYREEALELIQRNAEHISKFVAPCETYAAQMAELLGLPRERIAVVRAGLALERYRREIDRSHQPFVVGYLSVITPRKGLQVLVDAARLLVGEGRDVRLRVVGRVLDGHYWRDVRRSVHNAGLSERFEHLGEVDAAAKVSFLHGCSALCQPSVLPEVRGMTVIEAMAAGLPVVAPDTGVFPETFGLCGGGVTFESGNAESLAQAIAGLMDDEEATARMAQAGTEGIARYHAEAVTGEAMLAVCDEVLGK